jgi:small nuclear ribonucleoprotein D3
MRLFCLKFFKMGNSIFNILKETKPFLISIETKGKRIFRGNLTFIEENMNCILENTILIDQDGKLSKFKSVFLRGSNIKLFILPDVLGGTPYV